mmetsp:Transcript_23284/g.50905  ORF Transcript_23284/g.50905 Transcript_23284/m.50905 type:complete len:230 (+) Transcript_23284:439-1128(+)
MIDSSMNRLLPNYIAKKKPRVARGNERATKSLVEIAPESCSPKRSSHISSFSRSDRGSFISGSPSSRSTGQSISSSVGEAVISFVVPAVGDDVGGNVVGTAVGAEESVTVGADVGASVGHRATKRLSLTRVCASVRQVSSPWIQKEANKPGFPVGNNRISRSSATTPSDQERNVRSTSVSSSSWLTGARRRKSWLTHEVILSGVTIGYSSTYTSRPWGSLSIQSSTVRG